MSEAAQDMPSRKSLRPVVRQGQVSGPNHDRRLTILLAMHTYNVDLAKQYFDYREKLTSGTLLVYAGLTSFIIGLNVSKYSIVVSVTMMTVSYFAEFFVLKIYERSEYHFTRCRLLRDQIDLDLDEGFRPLSDIFAAAKASHTQTFKVRTRKRRRASLLSSNTHTRWAVIHRIFFAVGLVFFIAAFVRPENNLLEPVKIDWNRPWMP